ncbi:MAG: hypothetical protein ACHRHE_00720 [Tepidisphaerales bacterium]
MQRSEWISPLAGVILVVTYTLFTHPDASPRTSTGGDLPVPPPATASDKSATVSRLYDVQDLLAQADAFHVYTASLLTEEQRAFKSPTFPMLATNAEELDPLLQYCDSVTGFESSTSVTIGGRMVVTTSVQTHQLFEGLLNILRQRMNESKETTR